MSIVEPTEAPVSGAITGVVAVPIEDAGRAKEVAERVRQGEALLEVVSTPWGVEFYVRDLVRAR